VITPRFPHWRVFAGEAGSDESSVTTARASALLLAVFALMVSVVVAAGAAIAAKPR